MLLGHGAVLVEALDEASGQGDCALAGSAAATSPAPSTSAAMARVSPDRTAGRTPIVRHCRRPGRPGRVIRMSFPLCPRRASL
ncbi:hypothetical protein A33M_3719 [Rhodovulum sp. PH10]|nr:hypothetical protein A33M_3719 [Rhodovulum sp. PH10]